LWRCEWNSKNCIPTFKIFKLCYECDTVARKLKTSSTCHCLLFTFLFPCFYFLFLMFPILPLFPVYSSVVYLFSQTAVLTLSLIFLLNSKLGPFFLSFYFYKNRFYEYRISHKKLFIPHISIWRIKWKLCFLLQFID
jgi:hypothetical protein